MKSRVVALPVAWSVIRSWCRSIRSAPRRAGLHLATYRRLLRQHERAGQALHDVQRRRLKPAAHQRLLTLRFNRLARIRRALGLPLPGPRRKRVYRIGEAAALLGVSQKTLHRWIAANRIACHWSKGGHHLFDRKELLRVFRNRRV